jgi:hypothetical protein
MLVTNGKLTHRYDATDPRLGRHLELDSRSLQYTIEQEIEEGAKPAPIRPSDFPASIPILDQGQLGSCTGNAGTNHLSALYAADLSTLTLAGKTLGADAGPDEDFAVELYHEATVVDGFPGEYPPDDTGSSGLGVCKAAKKAGVIKRYKWGTTVKGVGHLLQTAGAMLGTPWYQAWFTPDAHGFIDADPNWQASGVAGGHELYVRGIEAWDDHDPTKSVLVFDNSWGGSWGDAGCGRMRVSTYVAVKQQADFKQMSR